MDALQSVVSQTFQNFVKATGITGQHVVEVKRFFDMFLGAATTIDHATLYGLFPVCLCFLVVHEHYRALSEGGAFRVGPMFAKVLAVTTLYLNYGRLCSVLLMFGGGGWMASDTYTAVVNGSNTALGHSWGTVSLLDLSSWGEFAVVFVSWFLVVASTLFAYIASYLLSLEQQALSMILLSLGKTALIVSLVPGVTVGKSWARYLASVAAWSTVAGAITALLRYRGGDIGTLMAQGDLVALLKAVAQFVVLGICMLRVPQITSQLVGAGSSVGAAALGMAAAGAAVWGMARGEQKRLDERKRTKEQEARAKERQASGGGGGGGGEGGGGGGDGESAGGASSNASSGGGGGGADAQAASRPHKVAAAVLKGGLNAIGAMPLGPVSRAADGLLAAAPKLAAGAHKAAAAVARAAFADSPEKADRRSAKALSLWARAAEKAERREAKALSRDLSEGSPGLDRALAGGSSSPAAAEADHISRDLGAPSLEQSQAALNHRSRQPTDHEAAMLRKAYPDLPFQKEQMSPVEQRIVAGLDHYGARFQGWQEGTQGRGDFAQARALAEHQVQAFQAQRGAESAQRDISKPDVEASRPNSPEGQDLRDRREPTPGAARLGKGIRAEPLQQPDNLASAASQEPRDTVVHRRPATQHVRPATGPMPDDPSQKGPRRQASLATPDPELVS